jgi:hypothetical protein
MALVNLALIPYPGGETVPDVLDPDAIDNADNATGPMTLQQAGHAKD